MAKKLDYSLEISDATNVASPDYGSYARSIAVAGAEQGQAAARYGATMSEAYSRYGQTMQQSLQTGGEANLTKAKGTAQAIESGGKLFSEMYKGIVDVQTSNEMQDILKKVGTPSEIAAQEQGLKQIESLNLARGAAIEEVQQGVISGTIFAQQAKDTVDAIEAKFAEDAAKFTAARDQNLISASEAANRITALAKERIAQHPGAAREIRASVAELTGMQNIEARDFQRALSLEEKAQRAAEKANEVKITIATDAYKQGIYPGLDPMQISAMWDANPQERNKALTIIAQRNKIATAAQQTDAQVKVLANNGTLTTNELSQNMGVQTAKVIADQIPVINNFVKTNNLNVAMYTNADGTPNIQAITTDKAKLETLQANMQQTFAAHFLAQRAAINSSPITLDQKTQMLTAINNEEKQISDSFKNLSGVATQVALLEKNNYDIGNYLKQAQIQNNIVSLYGDANSRLEYMLDPEKARINNPSFYAAMKNLENFTTSFGVNPKTLADQAELNARNGGTNAAGAAATVPKEALPSVTVIQQNNRKMLVNKYSQTSAPPEEQVKDARSLAYGMYFANFSTPSGKQELDLLINGGQLQNVLKNMTPENGAIVVQELHNNLRRTLSYNENNLSQRIVKEYQQVDKLYKETSKEGLQLVNDASGNMVVKYPSVGNVKGEIAAASSSLNDMLRVYNDLSTQSRVVASYIKSPAVQLPDAMSEARSVVSRYLQGGEPAKPKELQQQSFSEPAALVNSLWNKVEKQESGGKQSAVSPKGAVGVAQVMPSTGPEAAQLAGLPWDETRFRSDADYNRKLGQAYLQRQVEVFKEPAKALAAYNAGPGATQDAILKAQKAGKPNEWLTYLPKETQQYVRAILA